MILLWIQLFVLAVIAWFPIMRVHFGVTPSWFGFGVLGFILSFQSVAGFGCFFCLDSGALVQRAALSIGG
jgi:hypothetical protein